MLDLGLLKPHLYRCEGMWACETSDGANTYRGIADDMQTAWQGARLKVRRK
jgi:hypothetical protein